ncbi:hypothetical protein FPRO03_12462 [Fusarium proliferatum]|nr:hypothetical protein FPRO03_12462 [Fusarium proliferatum]
MARKRFRKSKKQGTSTRRDGPVWSNSHRLELLAFLNWCVQQDKGPDFYTLVADHLKRATKKSFTKVQIRKKLNHDGISTECQPLRIDFGRTERHLLHLLVHNASSQRPKISGRYRNESTDLDPQTGSQTRYFLQRKDLEDNLIQSGFPEADSADVTGGDVGQLSSPPSIDSEPNDVGTILASEPPPRPSIEAKLRMELLKAKGREFTMMNQISELERERYDRDQNKRAGPLDPNAARGVISRLQKQVNALQRLDDEFELLEYERFAFMGSSLGSECRRLY